MDVNEFKKSHRPKVIREGKCSDRDYDRKDSLREYFSDGNSTGIYGIIDERNWGQDGDSISLHVFTLKDLSVENLSEKFNPEDPIPLINRIEDRVEILFSEKAENSKVHHVRRFFPNGYSGYRATKDLIESL